MTGAAFFPRARTLSIDDIAELTGAIPQPGAARDRTISGVGALDLAGPGDLSFLDNPKYAERLAATEAGACLVPPEFASRAPSRVAVLVVGKPYKAFVAVVRELYPDAPQPRSLFGNDGVAAGAVVHPTARLEPGIRIDPGAVVGPEVEIGAGTTVGSAAVIGPGVRIGRTCSIGAAVTVTNAFLGDRVIVHSGTRIGQDGFGFLMGLGGHQKIPQIGRVIIQDNVEIGANCTIDRGSGADTIIGEGTKIDNLVQIGHNVSIGRHCVIVSQCGISGSVTLEDFVTLAGQVGIADHVTVSEGAQIGAGSGLMNNVPAGERWLGYPAMRGNSYLRRILSGGRATPRAR